TSGRGRRLPVDPSCWSPASTTIRLAAPWVADSVNSAGPTKPAAIASTTWLPTPARDPSVKLAEARPSGPVGTATWRPAPFNRPSDPTTLNRTWRPATGRPAASVSATVSGAARAVRIVPLWPSPATTAMRGAAAVSRRTKAEAWPTLPLASVATAVIVFSPGTSGTPVARKPRFATVAGRPFTVTLTWPGLTVPATMSLTRPATVTVGAERTEPARGRSIDSRGATRSRTTLIVAVPTRPP